MGSIPVGVTKKMDGIFKCRPSFFALPAVTANPSGSPAREAVARARSAKYSRRGDKHPLKRKSQFSSS